MKVSESWLRELANPNISTDDLVEQLTMAGLEIDAVEPVAGEFSGVIVGEIVSIEQHPNADKLRVCQVSCGDDSNLTQVVCGAPNARKGLKAPFAIVGAKLPGNFKIKKAKLRDVESFGMLCGQTELEAGDDDSGLWELPTDAPVGENLRSYLQLDDSILDVDLTPNRSDCLSVKGLAREVGVLNRVDVSYPNISAQASSHDSVLDVVLGAPQACPQYFGRIIQNVDANKPSPDWLKEKLRRSGVRSIDAIVDVTNFVLLELGQPLHAFDADKLTGNICVRLAHQDEKITLLDDQELTLKPNTLVIADDSGAIALAGIMGGKSTAVTEQTKNIFLEAAFFDPIAIAGRARDYGLHTDASHRFERGVDYAVTQEALERASELILNTCGGSAGKVIAVSDSSAMPSARSVELHRGHIESKLGFAIPDKEVLDILTRLGMTVQSENSDSWTFGIPSYRFDISIEADLLEELARIYGYNNLPTRILSIPAKLPNVSEKLTPEFALLSHLTARDYREVITYSFIEPKIHSLFAEGIPGVELLNPISADLSLMRTSLIPGLVQTLSYNLNRQQNRIRIFEKGLRFVPQKRASVEGINLDSLKQTRGLAGLIYGAADAESWTSDTKKQVDFYDIKGDVESLIEHRLGVSKETIEFIPEGSISFLHPGQSARVVCDGKAMGFVGALHPLTLKALSISKPVFVFELDLDEVLKAGIPSFSAVSKFPEVGRDLAVVVTRDISAASVQKSAEKAAGEHLKSVNIFDVYSGEGIDNTRKSIALNLTFQNSSRTLKEDEINISVEHVVQRLKDDFDATLR